MDDQQKEELKKKAVEWSKLAGKFALNVGKAAWQSAEAIGSEVGKAIDGMEKKHAENTELEQLDNYWQTGASAAVIFETIYKQFATKPIGTGQFRWRNIRPVPEYYQIFFETSWQHQNSGAHIGIGPSWDNTTEVTMTLTVEQLETGSGVRASYNRASNNLANADPFATQLIRNTNSWLKSLCEQFPMPSQG